MDELRTLREAIETELEMLPPKKKMDQFDRGAASAYNYVLSHWPVLATADKPLTERDGLGDAIDAMADALNAVDQTLDGLPDAPASQETIDSLAEVARRWLALVNAFRAATPTAPALDVERLADIIADVLPIPTMLDVDFAENTARDIIAALSPTTETPEPKPAKYCGHSWETDASVCPECGADWSGLL